MSPHAPTTLLASLALLLAMPGARAQADEPVRIALLPMVVHSAESPDYVRSGLSDMLAARLERISGFEVVRVDEPGAATTSLDKALKRAGKLDAAFVLFGSFTRFGTGASLDVQCAGAAAAPGEKPLREIFVHSGSLGDVIPDLDDLVGKVARFVIHDYSDPVAEAGAATDQASSRAVRDLERRVEALEAALRGLSGQLSTDNPSARVTAAGSPE